MTNQEYEDYNLVFENNYKDFKREVDIHLRSGYTLVGGFSFNLFAGTIYYAQAVAKLKEQLCKENQLTLS